MINKIVQLLQLMLKTIGLKLIDQKKVAISIMLDMLLKRCMLSLRCVLLAGVLAFSLAGCSSDSKKEYVERPVEELYNEGLAALREKEYEAAVVSFEEAERQHPYSAWATRAQLMAGYANFLDGRFDDALITLDRFIELNPGSDDIVYAYYLRAASLYQQITDVRRDQRITRLALESLRQVTNNFPESEYARDANLKIDLTLDHLAGKEMSVGRYYLRQHDYLAAINRFRIVVEQFDTTTHVPEALLRMVEAYLALGIRSESERIASVLGHNFPASSWYKESYTLLTGKKIEQDPLNAQADKWYEEMWGWIENKVKPVKDFLI